MTTKLHALPLAEARRYLGHLGQSARIDKMTFDDGPQRGSRLYRVVTGGGLCFDVHPDRALDIGRLEIFGSQVAWLSPAEIAHPAFYDTQGDRFLRTFGGGFLVTCGLDHFGAPCQVDGQEFGQHGRVNAIPAVITQTEVNEEELIISGSVHQVSTLQQHLELKRTIKADLGGTSFSVTDTVTNHGSRVQPHMILYHCNLGWPLVSEKASLKIDSVEASAVSAAGQNEPYAELTPPKAGYEERVYLHRFNRGEARVTLENAEAKLKMAMSFDAASLPGLCQWKMLGERDYVLGLEPTNTLNLGGRAQAKEKKALVSLAPHESVFYQLRFELSRP